MGANQYPKNKIVEGHKLTAKQSMWLNELIDIYEKTGEINSTQAALRAYDTDDYHSAGVIGHENRKRLKTPMQKALARVGVTDEYLAKKMQALLNAKQKRILKDHGEIKVIEEDDNTTQRYMAKLIAELRDDFPSAKLDITAREDKEINVKIVEDTKLKDANEPIEGEVVEDDKEEITSLLEGE